MTPNSIPGESAEKIAAKADAELDAACRDKGYSPERAACDARVREAYEKAAKVADDYGKREAASKYGMTMLGAAEHIAAAIRALAATGAR